MFVIDISNKNQSIAIGEILVAEQKLSSADFERAKEALRAVGGRLPSMLVELGLVSEIDVYSAVAKISGLPLIRESEFPVEKPETLVFNPGFLLAHRVLPLKLPLDSDGVLSSPEFVVDDPDDAGTLDALNLLLQRQPQLSIGLPSEINNRLQAWYISAQEPVEEFGDYQAEAAEFIDHLRDMASEAPIIQRVSQILSQAVDLRASDIHIESYEQGAVVRVRVDGELSVIGEIDSQDTPAVVSRIKILSQLDIAERRMPQDGRTKVRIGGREMDARVSTIPTQFGESLVIRLLEKSPELLSLDRLDFHPIVLQQITRILKQPHGVFLVTGPTGSGKSTTLYASLCAMDGGGIKILTVEDPVEYRLQWLNQVQVQPQIGLTFAKALRSFLRQDPDIIMIGEMRDRETAEIAVQAALTGHLVMSTLHTNGAVGAIVRLMNMGVEPYLIAASTVGVLAQRLVRRLCQSCKAPMSAADIDAAVKSLGLRLPEPVHFYRPVGCPDCRGSGYRGRLAIHELLPMTDLLKRNIVEQQASLLVEESDFANGSMLHDGAIKACAGLTTPEEVLRVARQHD